MNVLPAFLLDSDKKLKRLENRHLKSNGFMALEYDIEPALMYTTDSKMTTHFLEFSIRWTHMTCVVNVHSQDFKLHHVDPLLTLNKSDRPWL